MFVSVLVNTCDRASLLRLALASYLRQTEDDFEIVIADDGSTDHTPRVVETFAEEAPFPVAYVRHERRGHRRAAILNRGIERCRGEWVLFTDCDSLALADLVATHRRAARPDRMLCGGYVRLDREETEALRPEDVRSGRFEELLSPQRRRELRRKHWKAQRQIWLRQRNRPHNMGLNYSVARDALYRINGYDEEFRGHGKADGDVRERLRRTGVYPASLYDSAVVLHMWHPFDASRTPEVLRRNKARASRDRVPVRAPHGLRT